jgi:hypothetical protein
LDGQPSGQNVPPLCDGLGVGEGVGVGVNDGDGDGLGDWDGLGDCEGVGVGVGVGVNVGIGLWSVFVAFTFAGGGKDCTGAPSSAFRMIAVQVCVG